MKGVSSPKTADHSGLGTLAASWLCMNVMIGTSVAVSVPERCEPVVVMQSFLGPCIKLLADTAFAQRAVLWYWPTAATGALAVVSGPNDVAFLS